MNTNTNMNTLRFKYSLYVQQQAREENQTVHVSGPLMCLAAVLHRRRVLSCARRKQNEHVTLTMTFVLRYDITF